METVSGQAARPVIVGEVLFDRFPEGLQVLGGAPFNVAWHLQGFGLAPLLISRVGDDEAGRKVVEAIVSWGMDSTGVEIDPTYPTGAVDVRLSGEEHTFDILPDQAYDQISQQQLGGATDRSVGLLYQGTLIMRTSSTRDLLTQFHQRADAPLFVDLNLREPWWRKRDLMRLMKRARWAKVNETELEIVALQFNCSGEDLEESARNVQRKVGVELLIVTLGKKGARAFPSRGKAVSVVPEEIGNVADTVGAGDAFAAVSILGVLQTWPIDVIMERAQAFASLIVQQRGAIISDRDVYSQVSQGWEIRTP